MTLRPFREHHLLQLMQGWESTSLPLDVCINSYFRTHKALGSKDRREIAEAAFGMMRWKGLIDALCSSTVNWEERIACYANLDPAALKNRLDLPLSVRCSCPEELFGLLVEAYGEEKACRLALVSNTPAPITIRANTLKIARDDLLERWKGKYPVSPCRQSSSGIIFRERVSLFSTPEFQEGLFEMQDEASQLVADLVQVQPKQQVLDFCSGSGGKALAFAPKMEGKGQIFLHDIRAHALQEARKRLRRAGIQNAQVVGPDYPHLKKLKKHMDWVLVDAPCSGTGTLRRNPDMKWKIDRAVVDRLVSQQRTIFEQALSFLKSEGCIVFATCSVLPQENQEQVAHFQRIYGLEVVGDLFQTLPVEGGMDGFFAACMRRKGTGN